MELGGFGETKFALREGRRQDFLYLGFFAVASHGKFADQQITGSLKHLLFAEGERLGLVQRNQALQDAGNFEERPGAHPVGILLEAVFPISIAIAFGYRKKVQNLLDFSVTDDPPQSDAPGIMAGNHYPQAAGLYVQQVELLDRRTNHTAANLFDNSDAMIGVDDFVADVEILIDTAHILAPKGRRVTWGNTLSY